MGRKLEPVEREDAKERQREAGRERQRKKKDDKPACGKFPQAKKSLTREKVAEAVGMSHKTYTKAKEVVEAAEEEPEKYGHLKEKMGKAGKVDPVHKEYKKAQKKEAKNESEHNSNQGPVNYRTLKKAKQEIKWSIISFFTSENFDNHQVIGAGEDAFHEVLARNRLP